MREMCYQRERAGLRKKGSVWTGRGGGILPGPTDWKTFTEGVIRQSFDR